MIGGAIGAVLAASNVYTGLKSMFIDGGALTASLVGFALLRAFRRRGAGTAGPLDTNLVQTVASSAAVMSFVHGLMGPVAALNLLGRTYPSWALWAWGLGLAVLGILMGAVLRRTLILQDALPFPSGTATAQLIGAIYAGRGSGSSDRDAKSETVREALELRPAGANAAQALRALELTPGPDSPGTAIARRRTMFLVFAAAAAGLLTWLREGRFTLIPQAFYLPVLIAGIPAASLTVGLATSPIMAATGIFVGLRGALGLAAGSLLGFVVLGPAVVQVGWVREASFTAIASWLVWPAIGVLVGSALGPLLINRNGLAKLLARTLRDARRLVRRRAGTPSLPDTAGAWSPEGSSAAVGRPSSGAHRRRSSAAVALALVATAALLWTGWQGLGLDPVLVLVALLLAVVLGAVCARAAGETDVAPVGHFGMVTQLLCAGGGATPAVFCGGVVAGTSSQTAQTLWSLKAGHLLGAKPRHQIVAQLFGALVGSAVVVPTYLLIVRAHPLGTEVMPAVAALSWKATAEAIAGGLAALPPGAAAFAGLGLLTGVGLSALGRTRLGRLIPSATTLGIGLITPVSLTMAALLGACTVLLARRRVPSFTDADGNAAAAGGLAGESITGVLLTLFH